MNRIFNYYCEDQKETSIERANRSMVCFTLKSIGGVACRNPMATREARAADIPVLRDRARDAFGGDTKARFSFRSMDLPRIAWQV